MTTIKKFTIYGERCTGTNFLEAAITKNYNLPITWEFGWKHWWGFKNLDKEDTSEVLFIGIAKSLRDWIHSFTYCPHHMKHLTKAKRYWEREIYSIDERINKEIAEDHNIYTGKRYKNLFELYKVKHEVLLGVIPKQVKHFIFIHYSDLQKHYAETLGIIEKTFGLAPLRKGPSLLPVLNYQGRGKKKCTSRTVGKKRIIPDKDLESYIKTYEMEEIVALLEDQMRFKP